MRWSALLLPIPLLALGCGTAERAVPSTAELVARWGTDRPAAMRELSSADPLQQRIFIESLLLAHPQDQRELCALVAAGSPAGEHCAQREHRPHLFGLQGGAAPRGTWPELPPPRASWETVAPLPADCAAELRCARDRMEAAAAAGEAAAARQSCRDAWPEGIGREECLFRAGELLAEGVGLVQVDDALALCGEAGRLGGPCAAHVLDALVPEGGLGEMVATAATLEAALPAPVGERSADVVWALWTLQLQEDAPRPTAAGAAELPAAARPHLRMALAWFLLAEEPPEGLVFAERAAELHALVSAAGVRERSPRHRAPAALPEAWLELWATVPPAEAGLPRHWVMGGGRRTVGLTDQDDAKIAILEAAARLPAPAPAAFFQAGLAPEEPERVRWTAARLLGRLHPQALPSGAGERSALVRGRLGR